MKVNIFVLIFGLLIILTACQHSETKVDRISLKRSPQFLELKLDSQRYQAADFIEDYLNIMFDSTQSYRNSFWQSDLLYNRFDRFLKIGRAKSYLIEHPPHLLGIRRDSSGFYRAKIAFLRDEFAEQIVELLMGVGADGRFYFIEGLGANSKDFVLRTRGGVAFYYSPKCKIDSLEEDKVIHYNQALANYFGSTTRSLRIMVCKDLEDYAELLGLDYSSFLNLDRQTGGRALPDEDLYISANGSPYYPHELVHIYTAELDPHPFMDEGMATYLGGSGGVSLDEHLQIIAPRKAEFDFSQLPEDFYLYENYQASYLIGGMLLKMAERQYGGKESVLKLLSSGREDADLFLALEEVFGIKKEELDAFIKEGLATYLPSEE